MLHLIAKISTVVRLTVVYKRIPVHDECTEWEKMTR